MKKLFALLIAVMMVLSLAACGGNDDPDPSGSGTGQQGSEQTGQPSNGGEKEALVKQAGDTASYGTYNGQPIEWLALAVDLENEKALLVSKDAVAMMPFDGDDPYSSDWESSTIRTWLNNDFVNTAFTSEEASKILTTTISVVANSEYGTIGGSPTTDKVFLLSEEEINRYFPDGESRCINYEYEDGTDLADWWTITPGENSGRAVVILAEGTILTDGYAVGTELGIRPAIWISLSDETTNTVSGEVKGDPAKSGENGLDESSFQWKDNELTASVPKPGFGVLTGSILMPNNASYTAKVAEITDEQAADYLTQAQNADWNGEKSEQDGGYLYNAAASDGRTMELNYNRGLLVITIKPAN